MVPIGLRGGDESHYNSASEINTHISEIAPAPQSLGFIAYLISDGDQVVELDEVQVTYSENIAPVIDAGSNKSCYDEETIQPFADCSFFDPDGTVVKAYYRIDGEVDVWTEIPQGGYSTLLEAVKAFTYTFSNPGTITARLQVEDDGGAKTEDYLAVTVNKYQVTFNIKDAISNEHLTNIRFTPGDGSPTITTNSPFVYEYEWGEWAFRIERDGYSSVADILQVQSNASVTYTLGKLLTEVDIQRIAAAVWERDLTQHNTPSTAAELLKDTAENTRTLKEIELGRWKIENNQLILYDSNDQVIARFNLYDAQGLPSPTNVFDRVPA